MFNNWNLKDTKELLLFLVLFFALLFFVFGFNFFYQSCEISKIEDIRYCPYCGLDLIKGK